MKDEPIIQNSNPADIFKKSGAGAVPEPKSEMMK